jgi:hypothetical protein
MKKQKDNLRKGKIILVGFIFLFVILSIQIASANMYETIQSLEGKGCYLQTNWAWWGNTFDLDRQFMLTYTNENCTFVVDYYPYSLETQELIVPYQPLVSEIKYKIIDGKEYLFILGKDYDSLQEVVDFVADYETYQYYIKNYDTDYPYNSFSAGNSTFFPNNFLSDYNSSYAGPEDQSCIDNSAENVYLGNSGSYYTEDKINFNSSCIDSKTLSYGFCFGGSFMNYPYSCNCVNNKCIATPGEVYNYIGFQGVNAGPALRLVDNSLIDSAVKSWINN